SSDRARAGPGSACTARRRAIRAWRLAARSGQFDLQAIVGDPRGDATLPRERAHLGAEAAPVAADDLAAAVGEHGAPHAGVATPAELGADRRMAEQHALF